MTLEIDYKNFDFTGSNKYMMFCYINQAKTDFVFHPHHLLKPFDTIDGIRMFSIEDVAAMKLQAVTQRGSKKDFYDVWQLLQIMTAQQLIKIYAAKYTDSQVWMLLNSLIYFTDAEQQAPPKIFINNLSWDKVKKTIIKAFKSIAI
jgi:predicted nucleotidyltransferase component of viral defense system